MIRRALLLAMLSTLPAWAEERVPLSLLQAYDSSLHNDPAFQKATFDYQASQEEEAIGLSGLLPQISVGSRYGQNKQLSGQTANSNNDESRSTSSTLNLSARQVLYSQAQMAVYEQSQARDEAGSALYDDSAQELFNRVTEAYFDVARQDNELKLATQQKAAIEGLVKQTQRLLEAGDGTITDTEEAQARLDLIKAQEIEYQARMQAALRKLSGRAGLPVSAITPMQESLPQSVPLEATQDMSYWQEVASTAAPRLEAQGAVIKLAEAELKTQRAGHTPSLSLVSELSKTDQSNLETDLRRQSAYYVGLSLDVPLYSGGGVSANVRRSQYALSGAMAQYDAERQQIAEDIEREYLGVVSGYAKCKALQTAVRSNQRALESAEKGYQAGVRSTVDILNAQQVLYAARRDLLNTKLLMLQSYVGLHARTGKMHRGTLQQVQELF